MSVDGPSSRKIKALAAALFLAAVSPLHAHAVFSAKGPFFGGLKHFGASVEDILAATAVGIIAAQQAVGMTGKTVLALVLGWCLGGMIGLGIGVDPATPGTLAACSILILGVVGAIGHPYGPAVPITLACAAGLLHGVLNGAAMQPDAVSSGLLQLLGIVVAGGVVATYPSALLDLFRQRWVRIVARVVSSWIAATGLLLLGWSLRPTR